MKVAVPRSKRLSLNMTPMIDVVFLLIIFFLVSSQLAQQESRVVVELPKAETAQPDLPDPTPRLTLTIAADGTVYLADQPVSLDDLHIQLEQRWEKLGPEAELRIRVDRNVRYALVGKTLQAAARVGIARVVFAALPTEGRGT